MILSTEKPSCWDRLSKVFSLDWNSGMIVTYGGVIYCKDPIAPDFLAHELVHVKQQRGHDPEEYLERYINDPEFRKESEISAYRVQSVFLEETIEDPDKLYRAKESLCRAMVRNYGDVFTYEEAKLIVRL